LLPASLWNGAGVTGTGDDQLAPKVVEKV